MRLKLTSFALLMSIGLSLSATEISRQNLRDMRIITSEGTAEKTENVRRIEVCAPMKGIHTRADETAHTVTLRFLKPEKYYAEAVAVISETGVSGVFVDSDTHTYAEAAIPTGTYDFAVCFMKMYADGLGFECCAYVIKENIFVDKDMEIEIDGDEATEYYDFSSVRSDGRTVELPWYIAHENPDSYAFDMELVKEGTVDDLTIKHYLWSQKQKGIFEGTMICTCNIEDFRQFPIEECNAYINKTSGYFPIQLRAFQSGETSNEVVSLVPSDMNERKISNSTEDFMDTDIPLFDRIWASESAEHRPAEGGYPDLLVYCDGIKIGGRNLFAPALLNNIDSKQLECSMIRSCLSRKSLIPRQELQIKPRCKDLIVRYDVDTLWYDDKNYQIFDMSQITLDFGREIIVFDKNAVDMGGQILTPLLSTDYNVATAFSFPWHPYFPEYDQIGRKRYNANQPYLTGIFAAEKAVQFGQFTYLDNLGGEISTYQYAGDYILEYNGQTLVDSSEYDDLINRYKALERTFAEVRPVAPYELELRTMTGRILGHESSTVTNVKFGMSEQDGTAPILTIMSFTDTEGNFTTSFNKPEDGCLLLAGGDFKFGVGEGYDGTDAFVPKDRPNAPVVEYASYGSTEWKLLEVQPTESYGSWSYGSTWEVSLASISASEAAVEYDIRVTMTDDAGNSMSQVISPAFRIGDTSGIDSLSDAELYGVSLHDNSILGPTGMEVYTADGRRCEPNGLRPGLYIVRLPDHTLKIIL